MKKKRKKSWKKKGLQRGLRGEANIPAVQFDSQFSGVCYGRGKGSRLRSGEGGKRGEERGSHTCRRKAAFSIHRFVQEQGEAPPS